MGGHDIDTDNAAIAQILGNKDFQKVYIFLTKEFEKRFEDSDRLKTYESLSHAEFQTISTGIENPTMQKEIYNKIKKELSGIVDEVKKNKDICFVNLSSGTPDIKSVWSVLIATGELPNDRFCGIYAPNPKYDTTLRIDDLKFYKNSYLYKIIQLFIEKSNYLAISELEKSNKDSFKDITDSDFIDIVNFAKYRSTCDYEEAEKIYKEKNLNNYFEYTSPTNLFEKSCEFWQSAKISHDNNDEFSTTIKLGIIRENILEYLVENLLGYEKIGKREQENKPYTFDIEKIRKNEPDLEEFLQKKQNNAQTAIKEFNFKSEITAYSNKLILEYLIQNKYSDKKTLKTILNKYINQCDDLPKQRNIAAHTIKKIKYNSDWLPRIETILNLISEYFNISYHPTSVYEGINRTLKEKLKIQN